ncbi:MAG TPA: hypothetical protein DHV48_10295 [Prolixibacteraceae bacterium]|nr:hypothetical protein [Prolixibacteraceae bacterium]
MQPQSSFFMMDNSVSDNKESIIDYMLSWTMRMSCVPEDGFNSDVRDYCRKILSIMVFGDIENIDKYYKSIQSVKTWRQWKRIDLCAEIEFIDQENKLSKHALLIENKAYSSLHNDQLNRYKKIFEEEYKGTPFENNLHYLYFTIKDREKIVSDGLLCDEANFRHFTMDEIMAYIWKTSEELMLTGNDIFDEFWIKNWG